MYIYIYILQYIFHICLHCITFCIWRDYFKLNTILKACWYLSSYGSYFCIFSILFAFIHSWCWQISFLYNVQSNSIINVCSVGLGWYKIYSMTRFSLTNWVRESSYISKNIPEKPYLNNIVARKRVNFTKKVWQAFWKYYVTAAALLVQSGLNFILVLITFL